MFVEVVGIAIHVVFSASFTTAALAYLTLGKISLTSNATENASITIAAGVFECAMIVATFDTF